MTPATVSALDPAIMLLRPTGAGKGVAALLDAVSLLSGQRALGSAFAWDTGGTLTSRKQQQTRKGQNS